MPCSWVGEEGGRVVRGHRRKQEDEHVQSPGYGDGFVTECIKENVNCTF